MPIGKPCLASHRVSRPGVLRCLIGHRHLLTRISNRLVRPCLPFSLLSLRILMWRLIKRFSMRRYRHHIYKLYLTLYLASHHFPPNKRTLFHNHCLRRSFCLLRHHLFPRHLRRSDHNLASSRFATGDLSSGCHFGTTVTTFISSVYSHTSGITRQE